MVKCRLISNFSEQLLLTLHLLTVVDIRLVIYNEPELTGQGFIAIYDMSVSLLTFLSQYLIGFWTLWALLHLPHRCADRKMIVYEWYTECFQGIVHHLQ